MNFNRSQEVPKKLNVRYLVTVELIDGTFIHLISEFSQKNLFVVKGRAKFSFQFYNKYTLSVSLSKSVQFTVQMSKSVP